MNGAARCRYAPANSRPIVVGTETSFGRDVRRQADKLITGLSSLILPYDPLSLLPVKLPRTGARSLIGHHEHTLGAASRQLPDKKNEGVREVPVDGDQMTRRALHWLDLSRSVLSGHSLPTTLTNNGLEHVGTIIGAVFAATATLQSAEPPAIAQAATSQGREPWASLRHTPTPRDVDVAPLAVCRVGHCEWEQRAEAAQWRINRPVPTSSDRCAEVDSGRDQHVSNGAVGDRIRGVEREGRRRQRVKGHLNNLPRHIERKHPAEPTEEDCTRRTAAGGSSEALLHCITSSAAATHYRRH